VQETFAWLRQQGFARLAFHFARYNIPAYALPYVNFFILDEMGGWASAGSAPGDALLARLRELRGSAGYAAWSCAAWLRDLDLERWNLSLARVCRSLEALAALPDSDAELARLVPVPADREKLQAGRRELREFQQYYSATGSLLQRHGLERHAPAFLRHGISVDVLALLTDAQLQLIGIEPAEERLRLLQALRSLSSPVTASSAASSSSSSATTAAAASTAARSSSALAAGARTSSTGGRTGDAGRARVRGEAGAGLRTQGAPSVRQLVSSVHREDRRSIDDLVEFIQQRSTAPPSTKTAATTRASTASSGKGKQKQQQQQQQQQQQKQQQKQQQQQQQQRASSKAAARAAAAATPPKASENSNTPRSPATVSSVPAPPAPVTSDAEAAPADSSVANGQPAREAPPPGNAEAEAEAAASGEDVEAGMWAALDAEVEEFRRRLEQCSSGALSRPRIAVALPGLHAKPASRVPA
jgi:chemotaxis protein histidine kinase CheA